MRIFVTRHGQVATDAEYIESEAYPRGDMPLSNLGREQARLLAVRLKADGFCGNIYASPFVRTMETADVIARELEAAVIPTPALHEIFQKVGMVEEFRGKSTEELRSLFESVSPDAELPSSWWVNSVESAEDVRYRVSLLLKDIMSRESGDVLLIGHGASVDAVCTYLTGDVDHTPFYNCSYTVYDTATKRIKRNDPSHLPIDKMTYNRVPFLEKQIDIPDVSDALLLEDGVRVLHIGDTQSWTYSSYLSLVKRIKPDIIIHTGDTADEMKVSRDIEIRDLYLDRASGFLRALCNLCKRVIWVPGNNDLAEKILALVPSLEYREPGSVFDIEGVSVSLAHEKKRLGNGAEVNFYGHSTRYETWSNERNYRPDAESIYLNAMWCASVIHFPSRKLCSISIH